ncbi:MAG: serine/threonine-protein kinase [bacterium]|nr:serine/threonine-protein kinase [bacterium]
MIGTYISEYKISKRLSSTSLTDVYLGIRDKRKVAIKVLRIKPDTEKKHINRFFYEAEIMQKLNHKNIPEVYNSNREDDICYIVLEYFDGHNLRELISRHHTLLKNYIDIILNVCETLEYIHKRGIIHQDIKSRNMILTRDMDVKIIDFGLAYEKNKSNVRIRERAGTPHYMSPEQIKGYRGDERSDIYSLGVVMYELITGRRPFEGNSFDEIVTQQVNMLVKSPRFHNQEMSKDLENIILRTLNVDPAKRYQSVEELVLDIKKGM